MVFEENSKRESGKETLLMLYSTRRAITWRIICSLCRGWTVHHIYRFQMANIAHRHCPPIRKLASVTAYAIIGGRTGYINDQWHKDCWSQAVEALSDRPLMAETADLLHPLGPLLLPAGDLFRLMIWNTATDAFYWKRKLEKLGHHNESMRAHAELLSGEVVASRSNYSSLGRFCFHDITFQQSCLLLDSAISTVLRDGTYMHTAGHHASAALTQ
jgi:hypothetical protein